MLPTMKHSFRKLLALGVVAAFLLMAVAMVLPHSHASETAHHACWICHSKAVGVSPPEVSPRPAAFQIAAFSVLSAPAILESQSSFLFSEARAPPQL